MGAKYVPTIKDLKASQRFQQKQNLPKSTFKKTPPPASPGKPQTSSPASAPKAD
jgi:hypothetical protein